MFYLGKCPNRVISNLERKGRDGDLAHGPDESLAYGVLSPGGTLAHGSDVMEVAPLMGRASTEVSVFMRRASTDSTRKFLLFTRRRGGAGLGRSARSRPRPLCKEQASAALQGAGLGRSAWEEQASAARAEAPSIPTTGKAGLA